MRKLTKKQIGNIWKVGLIALIIFVFFQSYYYEKAIKKNPFELTAEVIGIENCYKNGRCIVFQYEYKNKTYTDRANSDWAFSNWCKEKNDCRGYKFKLTIDKDNPEKNITDWEKLFREKEFVTQ